MTTITAAVLREPGGRWTLEALELDEPRADEVLVRIEGVGVCHTDLSIRDQYLPLRMPIVLGHEGAGVVERVGAEVRGLAPGDHVVLAPLSCGECRNCERGLLVYCERAAALNVSGRRFDGSATLRQGDAKVGGAFFGQSSFATHALAHRRNAIKVDAGLPLAMLGPLGCGIQTGAGTVMNALRPPEGASLAVFGSGSVGLSAIMAARLARCETIVAVDIKANRLELALALGATHTVEGSSDAGDAIRDLTGGRGVDFSIDTTALPAVIRQAVDCLAVPGTCAVVGLAPWGTEVALDVNGLGQGRTVRGVIEGESVPETFIPVLIELWRQGRFPFDRLVRMYPFAEINRAAADMASGEAVKPVLLMPGMMGA